MGSGKPEVQANNASPLGMSQALPPTPAVNKKGLPVLPAQTGKCGAADMGSGAHKTQALAPVPPPVEPNNL